MTKSGSPKGTKMTVDDTAFDPIAAALKQMHQDVADEELPDDFLRLLDEIDAKIAADKLKQ